MKATLKSAMDLDTVFASAMVCTSEVKETKQTLI